MPPYNNGAGYFLYVNDISEVYRYNVPKGSSMFFMHKDQPLFYIKSVDTFNQMNVKMYDLTERQPEPMMPQIPNASQYVTRDELTSIIQETIRNELRSNRNHNNRKEAN